MTSCKQQRTSLTEVIANKDSLRHVTETETLKTHDHCLVVNRFCSQEIKMSKVSLAIKAAKLPIFQMFLMVRKEWANVTPLKNGDCRVSFWDDSSFILRKDGSVEFEYVVDHIKYSHITPLFFVAKTAKDAKKQYLSSENSWMKHDDVRVVCLSC